MIFILLNMEKNATIPDFRRFSQNLVLSVDEHAVFEEIFDFSFA